MAEETKTKKPVKEPKEGTSTVEKAPKAKKPDATGAVPVVVAAAAAAAVPGAAAAAHAGPVAQAAPSAPTAAELLGEDPKAQKIIRAKGAKNVASGLAFILATFNNTQVSITDAQGNVLGWSTAGRVGFKGSRKSTAFAAQQAAQDAARQAMSHGMREVEVRVNGPGSGRESADRKSVV